jgi:hypothetical protein
MKAKLAPHQGLVPGISSCARNWLYRVASFRCGLSPLQTARPTHEQNAILQGMSRRRITLRACFVAESKDSMR